MTGAQALRKAVLDLTEAGIEGAARDARWLLAHALEIDRDRVTLITAEPLSDAALLRFEDLVRGRAQRRPLSHLIGSRAFFGRDFYVTPDVLDPRPETETLIEAALRLPFETVLDLGTGSGCILLTLLAERPQSSGLGTDISTLALDVANHNCAALKLEDRAIFTQSNWFEDVTGPVDLIVSNPPYITSDEMTDLAPEVRLWEPHLALTPGSDGLDAYRVLAAHAQAHLNPKGWVLFEIGATQGTCVTTLLEQEGFIHITRHTDLDGRDRVVAAQAGK